MALKDIDTIVYVLLENRSFDHMCGYLSMDPDPLPVEGLRDDPAWLHRTANWGDGPDGLQAYPVNQLTDPTLRIQDPPHAWQAMAEQINTPTPGGMPKMGGFVSRYIASRRTKPGDRTLPDRPGAVMGYYAREDVWMYDFFARNYCVCDHWFAPLPAGTHPNRLMALAGYTDIYQNTTPLPDHHLVYDWLKARGKEWRCYVWDGMLPFAALIPEWWLAYLASFGSPKHFKHYRKLAERWSAAKPPPSVIFVEPRYAEFGIDKANDDHSPAPIYAAQDMLFDLYTALTSEPERWARTLLIVTYDEPGGFFDHVPPLAVPQQAGSKPFETTGPRVPAFLVSPHVAAGVPFHEHVDHTSVLALIGEKFGGGAYSPEVDKRQLRLGGRLANALLPMPRTGAPPRPVRPPEVEFKAAAAFAAMAETPPPEPDTLSAAAYHLAACRTALGFPEALEELSGVAEAAERAAPAVRHLDHIGDD